MPGAALRCATARAIRRAASRFIIGSSIPCTLSLLDRLEKHSMSRVKRSLVGLGALLVCLTSVQEAGVRTS
jgi:hypothetical protein